MSCHDIERKFIWKVIIELHYMQKIGFHFFDTVEKCSICTGVLAESFFGASERTISPLFGTTFIILGISGPIPSAMAAIEVKHPISPINNMKRPRKFPILFPLQMEI